MSKDAALPCPRVNARATCFGMMDASNISRRRLSALTEGGAEYTAKRAKIIDVAAHIFKESGFKGARLTEIAEAAGLDRATLYYYFESKNVLFQEAVGSVFDENLRYMEALLNDSRVDAVEKLRLFIRQLMCSYSDNFPYPYIYIQEQMQQIGNDDTPWAEKIKRTTRELEGGVTRLLREGVAEGHLRHNLPIRVAASALFGMLNWTHRWYEPDKGLGAESLADHFADIFFDGVRQQP